MIVRLPDAIDKRFETCYYRIEMARTKNPDSIPTTPGVFTIWLAYEDGGGECLYVSGASNLRNRVNQHHLLMRYLTKSQVRYRECKMEEVERLTQEMTKKYNPQLNFTTHQMVVERF